MKSVPKSATHRRWRVYGGRHPAFVMSVEAPTAEEAISRAAATLTARPIG